jgi:hypothetical protein
VIQRRPEIADSIPSDKRTGRRNVFDQSCFVDLVAGIRLCLDNYFVRAFIDKTFQLRYEIVDVMLCPFDLQP